MKPMSTVAHTRDDGPTLSWKVIHNLALAALSIRLLKLGVLMMLFEDPNKWRTLASCLDAFRAQKLLELAKLTRRVSTQRVGPHGDAEVQQDTHTARNLAAVDMSTLMISLQASLEYLDGGDAFEDSVERFGKGTISMIYLVAGYYMTRELIIAASQAYHEQLPADMHGTPGTAPRFRREQ